MEPPVITRDDLLRASLKGEGVAFVGPEQVWLDITPRGDDVSLAETAGAAGSMPPERVQLLARRLAEGGTRRVVLGCRADPLLHPQLADAVRALAGAGLEVALQSPLGRISPETADRLLEIPLDQLVMRLHEPVDDGTGDALSILARRDNDLSLRIDCLLVPRRLELLPHALDLAGKLRAEELCLGRDRSVPGNAWDDEAEKNLDAALLDVACSMVFLVADNLPGPTPRPLDREALLKARFGRYLPASEGFVWDAETGRMVCPAGKAGKIAYTKKQRPASLLVEYDEQICEQCALIGACPVNHLLDRMEFPCTRVGPFAALLSPPDPPDRCLLPLFAAWIDVAGRIWSCPPLAGSAAAEVGDAFEGGSWHEAFNSQRMVAWRSRALGTSCVPPLVDPCDDLAEKSAHLALLHPASLDELGLGEARDPRVLRWIIAVLRQRELRADEQKKRAHEVESDHFEMGLFVHKIHRRDAAINGQHLALDAGSRRIRAQEYQITRHMADSRHLRKELQRRRFEGQQAGRSRESQGHRSVPGADIALLMPPFWGVDKPPLGVAFLSEYLRFHDLTVELLDLNVQFFNRSIEEQSEQLWDINTAAELSSEHAFLRLQTEQGRQIEDCAEQILKSDTPIVGFSVNYRNRPFALAMARMIKDEDPSRLVIFGGPEAFSLVSGGAADDPSVDMYVLGEGEEVLLEIIRRRQGGSAIDSIPGTFMPALHQSYELRPPVKDLDSIPFPTYADLSLADYQSVLLPFLFSRGCINRCAYCMDHVLSPRFRCRSGQHAAQELQYHVDTNHTRQFNFNDLICNGNLRKLEQLSRAIIERELDIVWWSYATIRKGMTRELLELMRDSGCTSLLYGFESGSDSVLQGMGKRYDAATAEQVLRDTSGVGLDTSINIIVGFPGETEQEFLKTCEFLRRNREHITEVINLSTLAIHPGSYMKDHPQEFGVRYREDGTWFDKTGITLEVRNARLERVRALLDELGIPLRIINREIPPERRSQQGR